MQSAILAKLTATDTSRYKIIINMVKKDFLNECREYEDFENAEAAITDEKATDKINEIIESIADNWSYGVKMGGIGHIVSYHDCVEIYDRAEYSITGYLDENFPERTTPVDKVTEVWSVYEAVFANEIQSWI